MTIEVVFMPDDTEEKPYSLDHVLSGNANTYLDHATQPPTTVAIECPPYNEGGWVFSAQNLPSHSNPDGIFTPETYGTDHREATITPGGTFNRPITLRNKQTGVLQTGHLAITHHIESPHEPNTQ